MSRSRLQGTSKGGASTSARGSITVSDDGDLVGTAPSLDNPLYHASIDTHTLDAITSAAFSRHCNFLEEVERSVERREFCEHLIQRKVKKKVTFSVDISGVDNSAVDEHVLASNALSAGVEAESEEHPADPHPCDDASWHSRSRRTRRDARIKAKGEYRAMLATDSCYHFMRSFDAYFDDASADIAFEQRLQNALDFEGSANLQPMRTVVRNEEEVVHSPSCSTCHIQSQCNDRAGHAHDAVQPSCLQIQRTVVSVARGQNDAYPKSGLRT